MRVVLLSGRRMAADVLSERRSGQTPMTLDEAIQNGNMGSRFRYQDRGDQGPALRVKAPFLKGLFVLPDAPCLTFHQRLEGRSHSDRRRNSFYPQISPPP